MEQEYDYDLFIIGGGSGGLATAKEAAALGLKTALADFVKPTPMGTKWGLGGTCVNVGCIPKKMMHIASLLGEFREDMKVAGWKVDTNEPHSWEAMASMVQGHTKQSNWSYVFSLNGREIKYYNRLARFVDSHTVSLTDSTGDVVKVTAKNFLVAVGGRPNYPDIPGAKEYCITSDDLFWLKKSPGKTLIVGASYVALECGGFLKGLGLDTTIMVRSILLRGYDQDMANRIGDYMAKHGVKFIRGTTPDKFEKTGDGKVKVSFKLEGRELSEEYDTVLLAIGRHADTKGLDIDKAGVKVADNGKLIVSEDDKTSVPHIYSIGDCAQGRPEFTPTAIMAGKLLVRRLAGKGTRLMDYRYVPATVFTPIEYGCVGYTEEEAINEYGQDGIVAYHSNFAPLEWAYVDSREEDPCYGKIVVRKSDDRVIGFHYFGPHAGEITQGFAVAVKKGVTKEDFDYTVPIHPTVAEEMVLLKKTKAEDPVREKDCCS